MDNTKFPICIFFAFLLTATLFFSCSSTGLKKQDEVDTAEKHQTQIGAPYSLEGKTITLFETVKDTEKRMSRAQISEIEDLPQPEEHSACVMIDTNKKFQTIEGIGGALTDASAETFYKLPKDKQDEIIEAYFDQEKGIGYTLCRTHIHSCDFSSSSYAYTQQENDTLLTTFDIRQDKKYKIPFIKEALKKANKSLRLFASPWSPPAWMKTNNHMLQGGKLKPEFFKSWANYFVKFFEEYEKEGISFWGLTVQNEPMAVQRWESCIYTAEEERDFVKNYLGPVITSSKYAGTKIIIWDHNRGIMYQRAKVVYDDPEASKYVWGTGYHWYVGNHFDNVKLHTEAFPDKKLIFTEGCVYPFNLDSINLWKWGERYGESLLKDLNYGATAWIDWNVLLDETGGPNHVSNFCFAPIIGNTKTGNISYMNSYYYMGHFSKFIKPGARRVVCSSNFDDILATAFLNKDKSLAVVLLNLSDKTHDVQLWIEGKAANITSSAHSIVTCDIR